MMFIVIVLVHPRREGRGSPLPPSCPDPAQRRQPRKGAVGSYRAMPEPPSPFPGERSAEAVPGSGQSVGGLGSNTRPVHLLLAM